jgi:hypothetical protein
VTQHGSFPGRPRGRRARHQADVPKGEGYPGNPADEREFPDLAPIRPSHARELDARAQDDWRGQPVQPGQHGSQPLGGQPAQSGYSGGYQPGAPGYGQSGSGPADPGYDGRHGSGQHSADQYGAGQHGGGRYSADQYGGGQQAGGQYGPGQHGADQYGADQYGADQYAADQYRADLGGPGQAGLGQAPWPDQEWPSQDRQASLRPQAVSAQQQPAQAPGQSKQAPSQQAQSQQAQPRWADAEQGREEDVPSWAEPDSVEAFSARWHRRGLDSRDERRSGRRQHRRTLIAAGGAAAVAIAVAVYFFAFSSSNGSANPNFGSLVTSFLPGEVQSVPDACGTVPDATLSQYLPGTTKQAAPPLNSGTNTECSWTLDNPPTWRVLEAQIVAYTPSALVANPDGSGLVPAGNGSATYAAEAAFASFEYGLATPSKSSGEPKATIVSLPGMPGGNDTSAFSATQVFNKNGETTDVATVYVRYRNVIVTAVVQGLEQSSGAKRYGPVSMSDLTAAATAVARQVTAKIV